MARVSVRWNMDALGRCIGANAMSAGYRTGLYHKDHQSPAIGNTQPVYDGDVRQMAHSVVGIVHTANYAAMRDNFESNTLLKAVGHAGG